MALDDDGPQTLRQRPAARDQVARRASDRYLLRDTIGRGGMGEVVVARDEQIGRDVAIKQMRTKDPSDRQVDRFLREARIQGRLDHPAIVPVHEVGRDPNGLPFFVMKKLAGTTLAAIIHGPAREHVGLQRLLRAFVDVCLAVEFAHVRGVIHRDLKPENIVLGDYGEVYVLDWGVAKVLGEADEVFDDIRSGDSGTASGAVIGTPGYMSPEQAAGGSTIGRPSDVYALGRMLDEILKNVPGAPAPEVEAACRAAQATDPAERPTARALADQVQSYLDGDRDLARRRALATEQLATARQVLESGDPEGRGAAIRFAGRALALDPESADAAAMVTSLIVEPPNHLPPALVATLDEEARLGATQRLRAAAFTVLTMAGVAVLIPLLSVKSWSTLVVAYTSVAVCFGALWVAHRRGRPSAVLNLVVTFVLALSFSRAAGPFMLTPAVIAGALIPLSANRAINARPWALVVWLLAASITPVALEAIGVFQKTTAFTEGGMIVHSAIFNEGGVGNELGLGFANLMLLGAICLYAVQATRIGHDARRQLRVQAWHLAHLAPSATVPIAPA